MLIVHHNDLDGRCSGMICRRWAIQEKKNFRTFEIDYNIPFPFEILEKDEEVLIVDFSLSLEDFQRLLDENHKVIWIDHHISAISKIETISHKLEGLRRDGVAACELCWEYFFPNEKCPIFVQYIGDNDVWKFQYGDYTRFFVLGMGVYKTDLETLKERENIWIPLFDDPFMLVSKICYFGEILKNYNDNKNEKYIKGVGFYAEFEGYKCVCVNSYLSNSNIFNCIDPESYDVQVAFSHNGEKFKYSFYSSKVDCSKIASKYGGGGHKGAAGCYNEKFLLAEKIDKNLKFKG